jgi:hypothetical protein
MAHDLTTLNQSQQLENSIQLMFKDNHLQGYACDGLSNQCHNGSPLWLGTA